MKICEISCEPVGRKIECRSIEYLIPKKMKLTKPLFLLYSFLFFFQVSFGQEVVDTAKYEMKDTVLAKALLEEGRMAREEGAYKEALKLLQQSISKLDTSIQEKRQLYAEILLELGSVENLLGKEDLSIVTLQKSLNILLDLFGENNPLVADCYYSMGICHESKNDFDKSLSCKKKSLEIRKKLFGENHLDVAKSYNSLGVVHELMEEFDLALEFYLKSLELYKALVDSNHIETAKVYHNLSLIYRKTGDVKQSIKFAEISLKIKSKNLGLQHPLIAESYLNLALALDAGGNHNKALKCKEKALEIYNELYDDYHPDVAWMHNNIGASYYFLGDYSKASEKYIECISYVEKQKVINDGLWLTANQNLAMMSALRGDTQNALVVMKDMIDKYKKYYGATSKKMAGFYKNLGVLQKIKGDYDLAMDYYLKSLGIYQKIYGSYHPDVADVYNNIGVVYSDLFNYQASLDMYMRAFDIRKKLLGGSHPDIAVSLNNLGVVYSDLGDQEMSNEYLIKALNIRKEQLGEDHPEVAHVLTNIGDNFNEIGNHTAALKKFLEAEKIFAINFEGGNEELAVCKNALGYTYWKVGNFDQSELKYKEALTALHYSKGGDITLSLSIPRVLETIGEKIYVNKEIYLSIKNRKYLYNSNELSDEVIDLIFNQLNSFYSRGENKGYTKLIHEILELVLHSKYLVSEQSGFIEKNGKLFLTSERSKSLLLYQSIQEADALQYAGIPDSLLKKEYDLRIDITYYDKKRQEKLNDGMEETDTTVLAISDKLFDLKQEYEALKERFEKKYPEYYNLKYDLSTVSLDYVQDTLLTDDQTLLEYFVGDSSIFIFTVGKSQYDVVEVKKDFPLDSLVRQLQDGLYGYYGKKQNERTDEVYRQSLKNYVEAAPKLYDKLIAPVKGQLKGQVIVVPDGVLGYVPFEALLSARPKKVSDFDSYPFLLHDHCFSYCYSATLLREMKEKQHKKEPSKELVAFAPFYEGSYSRLDEEFGAEWDSLATALDLPGFDDVLTRKDFTQLPNSGEEVLAASKLWDGDYYLNADATEDQFNKIAGDYRIVHLSTHGIADPRVGDYSYLAFAEQKDSIENEFLYVRDLYNTQLNADLVVLSACETAAGELQRGEGIISLARAFAYAGAKSILTTLWVVDDAATKDLTKRFYLMLKQGKTKDEALHLAKLNHLTENENARKHPFFWAAMIGVGDMSAME